MANTVLRKDYSGAGNKQRQTISVWVKRCAGLSGNQAIFSVRHTGNSNFYGYLRFKTDSSLEYYINNPSIQMITNRKFRDTNAWYHIVITLDTTQSTEADRLKIYINGVQETSFQTATYPSQNAEVTFGDDYRHEIGSYDSSYYFEGVMSHFYFITNTAYQASTFGSTDSTTGEWQITTSPTITYATNSFFILKDGNSVTDQSGQGNNYTVAGGTLSNTKDCPSNIFAIMNPLWRPMSNQTYIFDNANSRVYANSGTDWLRSNSTIGAKTGKWWYEVHLGTGNTENRIGWDSIDHTNETNENYYSGLNIQLGNGQVRGGIKGTSSYSPNAVQLPLDGGGNATWAQGDYLGMGIDLDSQTITIEKNGNALTTNWSYAGYSGTSVLKSRGFFIGPSANWYSGSGNQNIFDFNFGNGSFNGNNLTGTTYTDSQGNGVFKYEPPTNYLAWCTKNLNV